MNQQIDTKLGEFRTFCEKRFAAQVQAVAPALVPAIKLTNTEIGDLQLDEFLSFPLVPEAPPIGANLNNRQKILRIAGRVEINVYCPRGDGSGRGITLASDLSKTFALQDLSVANGHSVKFKYQNIMPLGVKDRWFLVQSTIVYLRDVHQL